jgi:hypothetical protein
MGYSNGFEDKNGVLMVEWIKKILSFFANIKNWFTQQHNKEIEKLEQETKQSNEKVDALYEEAKAHLDYASNKSDVFKLEIDKLRDLQRN